MNRFLYLIPLAALLITGCTDKSDPQQSSTANIPSYAQAAAKYQQQSKAGMEKMAPEDRAIMKQANEDLARLMPNPGLRVGDKAPDFSLPDANGNTVALSELLKQGPVVLVFYRGAWCPFCNMHLNVLNKSLPKIQQYGAQLVAVTPQRPDKSITQLKKTGYPFHVLSDLDSSVMKAYHLYFEMDPKLVNVYNKLGLDIAEYNGPGRYVLPVPGTLVIDRQGIIRAQHATTDYTQRMEPAEIIIALQTLDK